MQEREVGKFASSYDFRRSFGTRWAAKVMPAMLKTLMRHASVETTMKYYVDQQADDVAAQLWAIEGKSYQNDTLRKAAQEVVQVG